MKRAKPVQYLLLTCTLLLAGCGGNETKPSSISTPTVKTPIPNFTDAGLQACVEQTIAITGWKSLEEVTALNCNGQGVADLSGIEQLTYLTELTLATGNSEKENNSTYGWINYHNDWQLINDTAPKLTFSAANTFIDITPLNQLVNLTHLKLLHTGFLGGEVSTTLTNDELVVIEEENTKTLSCMSQLTSLVLVGSELPDLDRLINLEQLVYLTAYNQNSPISLKSLIKLKYLALDVSSSGALNPVELEPEYMPGPVLISATLNTIEDKSNLQHLSIRTNYNSGSTPLNVQELDKSIKSFTSLESLALRGRLAYDLPLLISELPKIKRLSLVNFIQDVSSQISLLKNLEYIKYQRGSIAPENESLLLNLTEHSQLTHLIVNGGYNENLEKINLPKHNKLEKLIMRRVHLDHYDFSSNSELSQLEYSYLSDVDLPLITLPETEKLEILSISNTRLSNIIIPNYPKLKTLELDIKNDAVINLQFTNTFPLLTGLKIQGFSLDSLDFLSENKALVSLELSVSPPLSASFFDPILNAKALTLFSLSSTGYIINQELDFLSQFTLTSLELINVDIVDLSKVGQLTELTTLTIGAYNDFWTSVEGRKNSLTELNPLSPLVNLRNLSINNTLVSDISVTSNFPKLNTLDVSYNELNILPSFMNSPELSHLRAESNNLTSIPVSDSGTSSIHLHFMWLDNNNIELLDPEIYLLRQDQQLSLKGNPLIDCLDTPFLYPQDITSVRDIISHCYL